MRKRALPIFESRTRPLTELPDCRSRGTSLAAAKLPLPEKIHLSPASQHDLSSLREVSPSLPQGCGLFADKAYFHCDTEQACKERGWFLVASYKRHRHEAQRDVPTLYNRFVSAIRQPLESLFNWLIQRTDLQNASRWMSDDNGSTQRALLWSARSG